MPIDRPGGPIDSDALTTNAAWWGSRGGWTSRGRTRHRWHRAAGRHRSGFFLQEWAGVEDLEELGQKKRIWPCVAIDDYQLSQNCHQNFLNLISPGFMDSWVMTGILNGMLQIGQCHDPGPARRAAETQAHPVPVSGRDRSLPSSGATSFYCHYAFQSCYSVSILSGIV